MNRRKWLVLAALVAVPGMVGGGLAYAGAQEVTGYTCPVTGETLSCEKCCPLNGEKAAPVEAKAEEPKAKPDGYTCPITGEKLGCPNCCPQNKAKK